MFMLRGNCLFNLYRCNYLENRLTQKFLNFGELRRSFALAVASKTSPCDDKKAKININVGTIGHIDHGKTTLTAAITKFLSLKGKTKFMKFDEIDKGKEEKKRGITINIAHVGYESNKRRYAHVDCPGHSDFIKNMICGTSQMDVAILVIAATDGVMKQTKEHLLLASQIGLKNIVIFINKADLVEKEDLELVEIEAREMLTSYGFDGDNAFVVIGSALNALGNSDFKCIEELIKVLDEIPEPIREQSAPFLLPVSSRVQITGRGTVVIGTVESGVLSKGAILQLKGFDADIRTTVSDIHIFKESVKEVKAGDHCGILCRKLNADAVRRGMWLGSMGTIQTTNILRVEMYLLTPEEGGRKNAIRSNFTEQVFCSTWEQTGRFSLDAEMLMPGEFTTGHIFFMREVPIKKQMTFTIRENSTITVARGIVTEMYEPVFIDTFKKFDAQSVLRELKPLKSKVGEEK